MLEHADEVHDHVKGVYTWMGVHVWVCVCMNDENGDAAAVNGLSRCVSMCEGEFRKFKCYSLSKFTMCLNEWSGFVVNSQARDVMCITFQPTCGRARGGKGHWIY